MDNLQKYKRPIFLGFIIGLLITFALLIFADIKEVIGVFRAMDTRYLPIILLLAPLNYYFRYVKWNYFLNLSDIKPDPTVNRYIFISGLSMTITPGKVGELLKCYLLKEHVGAPISKTSSIVMVERLTDGFAMVIIGFIGMMAFPYGRSVVLIAAAFIIVVVAVFQIQAVLNILLNAMGRFAFLEKSARFISEFYHSTRLLLSARSFAYSVGIGVISWSFEGVIVFLAVRALGGDISMFGAFFVIAISSIAGAISFLPGGLGVAEGSIMAILVLGGIDTHIAAATTLLTRFSTLWLGVAIGIYGLTAVHKVLNASAQNTKL